MRVTVCEVGLGNDDDDDDGGVRSRSLSRPRSRPSRSRTGTRVVSTIGSLPNVLVRSSPRVPPAAPRAAGAAVAAPPPAREAPPPAASISATYTIRKKRFVDVRVPVDASPAPPRHMAEPGHHAGHALHRARLERARQARPASEHMAFGPSTPNECTIDGLFRLRRSNGS